MRRRDGISVAVLAGGESSRMGRDKALVTLGGKPLVEHVIEALGPLGDDLFLVGGEASRYRHLGLRHVADQFSLGAAAVGVYSALAASRYRHCLVVSCDLPFASPALARAMARAAEEHDAVVPMSRRGPEPLFAVYSVSCLEVLEKKIRAGELALRASLAALDVCYLGREEVSAACDPEIVFFNVNTPADLERAQELEPPPAEEKFTPRPGKPPLVCFVGRKKSGKTTFLEKLVPELRSLGLEVACIKHDVHGFSADRKGTDSWRLARAGAGQVVLSGPKAAAVFLGGERERPLAELMEMVEPGVDIVLAEGYKKRCADKIEVLRGGRGGKPVCREEELLAVISGRPDPVDGIPAFAPDDAAGVARFLVDRYRLPVASGEGEEA